MAHEIDMSNDKANMAFVGELPWHGLGQQLTEDSPIEVWAQEAGMDWTAKEAEVIYNVDGKPISYLDRKVIYRGDNIAPLSVVSTDYKMVQPIEMLEFFRDLSEAGGFALETAGCLFGGKKFWALARVGESARIIGQDEIKPYLLIASSLDGSLATCAHFTSVRVVCNNTLRMSIGNGSKAQVRVPHQAKFDADEVQASLGIAAKTWDQFIANATKLAKFKIDRDDAIQVVADQLKTEWKKDDGCDMLAGDMLESSLVLRRIIHLYDGAGLGADYKSSKGTAWGLVNAVTQYFDHQSGAKSADRSRSFERAQLTDRASLKVRVADELLKMAA